MDEFLTTRVVARRLGVHPETVLKWMRAGELPAVRLPSGAVRYRPDEFERWLEERATSKTRRLSPTTPNVARAGTVACLPSPTTEDEEA